jgi:hypothetical protein
MYQVGYKDLATYPGKVRFGWLLSDIATDAAGVLKFSVRFVTNENGGRVYSLNTKTQTVTIYPALQKGMLESSDGLAADSAFYRFVRDSLAVGETPAQQPRFDDPEARNLPETINLNQDNTLTLSVQATKGDLGELTYTWRYKNAEGRIIDLGTIPANVVDDDEDEVDNNENEAIEGYEDESVEENEDNYTVSFTYEAVENPVIKPRVDYYYYEKGAEGEEGEYKKYIVPAGGIESGVELSERYATLTFNDVDTAVIGQYWVEAVNKLDTSNISTVGTSIVCTIPPLSKFEIVKDLNYNEGKIIKEVTEEVNFLDETVTTTSYAAPALEATYNTDPHAFYKYTLYKKSN